MRIIAILFVYLYCTLNIYGNDTDTTKNNLSDPEAVIEALYQSIVSSLLAQMFASAGARLQRVPFSKVVSERHWRSNTLQKQNDE